MAGPWYPHNEERSPCFSRGAGLSRQLQAGPAVGAAVSPGLRAVAPYPKDGPAQQGGVSTRGERGRVSEDSVAFLAGGFYLKGVGRLPGAVEEAEGHMEVDEVQSYRDSCVLHHHFPFQVMKQPW